MHRLASWFVVLFMIFCTPVAFATDPEIWPAKAVDLAFLDRQPIAWSAQPGNYGLNRGGPDHSVLEATFVNPVDVQVADLITANRTSLLGGDVEELPPAATRVDIAAIISAPGDLHMPSSLSPALAPHLSPALLIDHRGEWESFSHQVPSHVGLGSAAAGLRAGSLWFGTARP